MVPKRIILEGKSYLMLEENLGRLQYSPFKEGSINSKHYSNYEPITAIGIAPVDTVTRKTIDKKKVEVQDLKFAIKFKWDVDVLASNPDLFLRYYNYFESAPQTKDGKKTGVASTTVSDFMPFINDPVYSKTFDKILAGEGDEENEEANVLNEASEEPSEEELSDNLGSFDDGFTDSDEDPELTELLPATSKTPAFFFYLLFKYDELYDNNAKLKTASFTDGSNIEILKLVSEGHADDAAVAITGKVLERKAVGFYKELLGILNANHKAITQAVDAEEKELGIEDEVPPIGATNDEPISGEPELDFSADDLPGLGADTSNEEDPSLSAGDIPKPTYRVTDAANDNIRLDQVGRSDERNINNAIAERNESFNRFKQSNGG